MHWNVIGKLQHACLRVACSARPACQIYMTKTPSKCINWHPNHVLQRQMTLLLLVGLRSYVRTMRFKMQFADIINLCFVTRPLLLLACDYRLSGLTRLSLTFTWTLILCNGEDISEKISKPPWNRSQVSGFVVRNHRHFATPFPFWEIEQLCRNRIAEFFPQLIFSWLWF